MGGLRSSSCPTLPPEGWLPLVGLREGFRDVEFAPPDVVTDARCPETRQAPCSRCWDTSPIRHRKQPRRSRPGDRRFLLQRQMRLLGRGPPRCVALLRPGHLGSHRRPCILVERMVAKASPRARAAISPVKGLRRPLDSHLIAETYEFNRSYVSQEGDHETRRSQGVP